MIRRGWDRWGPFLWLRFRALGVRDPVRAVADFLEGAGDDAGIGERIVRCTRFALERPRGRPEPEAVRAFFCSPRQLVIALEVEPAVRLDVVLAVLDGMEPDAIARFTGTSPARIEQALVAVRTELDAAAESPPAGSQPDGHPSVVELLGYTQEALGPLRREQVEQHMANCSACFVRFEAWSEADEAFAAIPEPPRLAPPVDRKPLLFLGGALVLAVSLVIGGLGWLLLQREEEPQYSGERVEVALLQDGEPVEDVADLSEGALVRVRYRPRGASHVLIALREGTDLRLLHQGAVEQVGADGWAEAPFELIRKPGQETLYLVLASEPVPAARVMEMLDGTADARPPGIGTTVIPLGRR